jgi:hypothetical protein
MFALDYDGTIADTNTIKARWIRENLGIGVPPYNCDHTWCAPIIGEDAYKRMSPVVYNRENSLAAEPVAGAVEALKRLAEHGPVLVVTARDSSNAPFAAEWLNNRGLMRYIERVVPWTGEPKIVTARSLGCRALVDDDIRHLLTEPAVDLKLLLLKPGYTGDAVAEQGVILCTSWEKATDEAIRGKKR